MLIHSRAGAASAQLAKAALAADPRLKLVERAIKKFDARGDALLEVLSTAQEAFGYLSQDLMRYISLALHVPLARVYVVANFKETQLAQMRPGQRVDVTVDAYPGQPLAGRIESFAPASGSQFSLLPPENATGNFTKIVQRVPVRIALPASGPLAGLLRPGLSVVVAVDTRTGPGAAGGSLAAAPAP